MTTESNTINHKYISDLASNKSNVIHKIINDELNVRGFDYWKELYNQLSMERDDVFQELLSKAIEASKSFSAKLNVRLDTFLDRSMRNYLRDIKRKAKTSYENNYANIQITNNVIDKIDVAQFNNKDREIDADKLLEELKLSFSEEKYLREILSGNNIESIKKRFKYDWKLRKIQKSIKEKNSKIIV